MNVKIKEKNDELKAIKSLVDKGEDEVISWERKLRKVKNSVEEEKKNIERIKANYKKWKINILEDVARFKIKNKVDNIDKAGLSEVLNNG